MATDRLIGHDLARYHVEAILGRGGMGVVYRAIDTRLGRTVALKVLSDERSADPDFRERFLRESRLLASIDHPNIVPIYEADEADGQLYIAMRYVPGPELRLIIADEAPMDAAKTVAIIGQVADALDAAHVAGLVHRDVKPGNILVMPGATSALAGHAYLTDFGLTKSTGSDTGLTKIGQFVGTPGYVAPEQIEGKGVDHRVDIYALGCILYNCLSGDVPYPRDSTVASLWAHLKEPPPRLSEHRKGLPKGLDAVITKALAKSPDERYQTCGALAQAARTALEPARRKRVAAAGLAAGAATAAAGAGTGDAAEVGMGAATAETMGDPVPVPAASTVVDASPAAAVLVTEVVATPSSTVIETAAAPSTVIESAGPSPTVVESAVAVPLLAGIPPADAPADSQAPTSIDEPARMPGPAVGARSGRFGGNQRAVAAVLVAAIVLGVGFVGFRFVGGTSDSGSPPPSAAGSVAEATDTARPTVQPSVSATASTSAGGYVVTTGDTLASIAKQFGVTVEDILAANPGMSLANGVVVGQSVVIPPSGGSSPSPSAEPSVTPTPTAHADPPAGNTTKSAGATPVPDTKGPTGAAVVIANKASYTTTRKVKITLSAKPSDPSGISKMAVSNTSKRGSERTYDTSFTWTLSDGAAGKRTVYMWFKDKRGNWSEPSKDTIDFDHAPTAPGRYWDLRNNSEFCFPPLTFTIPGYAAFDSDGNGTLTVVDAWNGSVHYPVTATTVKVGVAPKPFNATRYTFQFKVKDSYGATATGTVTYDDGPCS